MINFLTQCQLVRHIVRALGYLSASKMPDIQLYSSYNTLFGYCVVIAAGALFTKGDRSCLTCK
jgi:hypothetical protein